MGIYSEEYVAVLHEAADKAIDQHKLEDVSLEHHENNIKRKAKILH